MVWEEGVATRLPSSPRARRPTVVLFLFAALALMMLLAAPGVALGGPRKPPPRPPPAPSEDPRLQEAIAQTMAENYPSNLGEARRKVQEVLDKCKPPRCTGATKAQGLVAIGMIQSQLGDGNGAKTSFVEALRADPHVTLPSSGTTPNIRSQWAEAQAQVPGAGEPAPAPAPVPVPAPVPAPAPGPAPAPAPAPPSPRAPASPPAAEEPATPPAPSSPGAPLPPGWQSREAFDLAQAGLKALGAGRFDECIQSNRASLEKEERGRTRLVLSRCEEKNGKYVDALKDAQKALELGIKARDAELIKVARPRVEDLIHRIPHVTFVAASGVTVAELKFDDRNVPVDALAKKYSIDPGKHRVVANGLANGLPGSMDEEYEVKEGELLSVRVAFQPTPGAITKGQLDCLLKATNDEEIRKCVEKSGKGLVVKVGEDTSGYADNTHVYVFSPEIRGQVLSPTSGWNVGGSYTLDVVTAASPDIVSEASHRYKEQRHAASIGGGYKPGLYGVQGNAYVSSEPDYVSRGVGIAATGDFNDKLITPRIGISYSHDSIGRGGGATTPGSPTLGGPGPSLFGDGPFSKTLNTTELEAGITWVLSPTAIIVTSGTAQFERGDQSKPYRYVPVFDPAIAGRVPVGATVAVVDAYRLPMRPLEQLPTARDRYAAGVRFAKRLGNATLRIEERLYLDTWSTKATTTDGAYMLDVSRRLRVWPHLRFHAQSGTNFYKLAYSAAVDPNTLAITLPTYRTGDRELSPMVTLTAGGGARFGITNPEASTQLAVIASGDLMYSHYSNALFITSRTAVYGTIGFELDFE